MHKAFRQISPVNLILTPIKQHLGCCVVAPLLIKLAGATVLAELIIKDERAEFLFLLCILPLSVWGILKLEDVWRRRHETKHDHAADSCATHCHPTPSHFKRRYITNLAMAFTIAYLMHHFFHHHHEIQTAPAATEQIPS